MYAIDLCYMLLRSPSGVQPRRRAQLTLPLICGRMEPSEGLAGDGGGRQPRPLWVFERNHPVSKEGIKRVATVFTIMQEARIALLDLAGPEKVGTPSARQDIMLSGMLEKAKDFIKDEFAQITLMETEEA